MRDDIDSWSRPRLAERLKLVGLRAHVAGDARPQQPRRGDDDMARSITVERSGTALFGLARVSGLGMGTARVFIYQGFRGEPSKNNSRGGGGLPGLGGLFSCNHREIHTLIQLAGAGLAFLSSSVAAYMHILTTVRTWRVGAGTLACAARCLLYTSDAADE